MVCMRRIVAYNHFMLSKFSLFKHWQVQINRCQVKCVNMTVKSEYFVDSTFPILRW